MNQRQIANYWKVNISDRLEVCKAAYAHGLVARASLSKQGKNMVTYSFRQNTNK